MFIAHALLPQATGEGTKLKHRSASDGRQKAARNTIRKRFTQRRRHEHAFLLAHFSHIDNRHVRERSRRRTILERQKL